MNIIELINNKTQELANIGLTDEGKVRRALAIALTENTGRNPEAILNQQRALMEIKFYGGDTRYVKGE